MVRVGKREGARHGNLRPRPLVLPGQAGDARDPEETDAFGVENAQFKGGRVRRQRRRDFGHDRLLRLVVAVLVSVSFHC